MKACSRCDLRYPADALFCFLDGAELTDIRDPLIGATIAGRYLVEEVIGQGGMATVYRARQNLVDRACAVKVMNRVLAADATVRERFRREAKNTQTLVHPNVVEIFDHGETGDGTPYMVMQLLDGKTLAELIHEGPLAMSRAIPAMIQLARGIARAHDLGVVHRDLKPENVFICRRDDGSDLVKILDFGIARSQSDPRLTGAGELFGTPQYMAPERVSAGEAGPSVDLYALGVIFYEAATGRLPFEANDTTTLLIKHLKERPRAPRALDPGIPLRLDTLVMQLLEKDPRARPVDAHRVEQDLLALAASLHVQAPPDPDKDPASAHDAALPSMPQGSELSGAWANRLEVFAQMLARSQSARPIAGVAPPPQGRGRDADELERLLGEMNALLADLSKARQASAGEQRALEELDTRGREGRQRFGFAVDALGLDASRARDELRAARIDFDRLAHQSSRSAGGYEAALREVVTWEGRSGLSEPYPQLAESHRTCAQAVDAWVSARRAERSAEATLEDRTRIVADLDYQMAELRAALAAHERAIDREHETAHGHLLDQNARADGLEASLLDRAARFCNPLRTRPELGPLFRRLESTAPTSSPSP
jgi:eukaryotic-like serine/threonine-protein kinase